MPTQILIKKKCLHKAFTCDKMEILLEGKGVAVQEGQGILQGLGFVLYRVTLEIKIEENMSWHFFLFIKI
jgi:hypothetical protein